MLKLTKENYNQEILNFLDKNELNQRELTKCGLTDATISKILNNKVIPGRLTLAKINNYIVKFEGSKSGVAALSED